MLKATDLQDLETNNFQYTAENENVTICIWANLSRNPRFDLSFYLFQIKISFLPLVAVAVGEDNASVESAIDQVLLVDRNTV